MTRSVLTIVAVLMLVPALLGACGPSNGSGPLPKALAMLRGAHHVHVAGSSAEKDNAPGTVDGTLTRTAFHGEGGAGLPARTLGGLATAITRGRYVGPLTSPVRAVPANRVDQRELNVAGLDGQGRIVRLQLWDGRFFLGLRFSDYA